MAQRSSTVAVAEVNRGLDEHEANAELIVKAVNAHDALVRILVEMSSNVGEPVAARKATRALAALTEQTEAK